MIGRVLGVGTAVLVTGGLLAADGDRPSFKFYGFIRGDVIHDDSRPNNTQTISSVLSEDPTAPASIGAGGKDRPDFTMHARLTRLGVDVDGPTIPELGGFKATGKVEVDFYNSGLTGQSESRAALRMRHAYVKLGRDDLSFLAGQTTDVISPIFPAVNPDMVMWAAGNLGDRRPQFRGTYTPDAGDGMLVVEAEAGLTGAVDNQDLDTAGTYGAGYRDGETSGLPTFQERVAYRMTPEGMGKLEVGVWAHNAWEEADTRFGTFTSGANERRFASRAVGLDAEVPLYKKLLWAKGEIWKGSNLDDVRGGILQGVNTTLGRSVRSQGGWAELGGRPFDPYTLSVGYSTDNPNDDDLNTANRRRNKILYLANRLKYGPVTFGLDYLFWETKYVDFDKGDDNRFQGFVQFDF